MTESLDSIDVKLSPSRLRISWRGAAIILAALLLLSTVPWGLSTVASNLPEPVSICLFIIAAIPLFTLALYTHSRVAEHEREKNLQTLRISSARIEYLGRGQEFLSCDRASLRVRRLRFVHPTGGESADQPDTMAIELSGPGLRPLVIYKYDMYSHEMWKQSDEVIRRTPEFTVERQDWTKLRAALGLER